MMHHMELPRWLRARLPWVKQSWTAVDTDDGQSRQKDDEKSQSPGRKKFMWSIGMMLHMLGMLIWMWWMGSSNATDGNSAIVPVIFRDSKEFVNADIDADNSPWKDIMTETGGYITLQSSDKSGLDSYKKLLEKLPGTLTKPTAEPGTYILSAFHSLHCVAALSTELRELSVRLNGTKPDLSEADLSDHRSKYKHATYCIEYIRQSLMCSSDLSLESPHREHDVPASTGWQAVHQCRDWEAIKKFVNERGAHAPDEGLE